MNPIDAIKERIDLHAAYVRVFSTEDGQKVLSHIAKHGFVTQSTFVAGDPQQTAMNEGMRRMALSIMKFVHRDHKQLILRLEQEMQHDNT